MGSRRKLCYVPTHLELHMLHNYFITLSACFINRIGIYIYSNLSARHKTRLCVRFQREMCSVPRYGQLSGQALIRTSAEGTSVWPSADQGTASLLVSLGYMEFLRLKLLGNHEETMDIFRTALNLL